MTVPSARRNDSPAAPGPRREGLSPEGSEADADGDGEDRRLRKDRLWPILITVGLALVFLVNGLFIYIAVKGADEVVPSYLTEER